MPPENGIIVLKIGVVTPIPTPYRDPFWNALAAREDIDLTVFYCAAGKEDRPWSTDWQMHYRSEILPGWNLAGNSAGGASLYWNPDLVHRLQQDTFDALVFGGYNHPTLWRGIFFAVRHGIPFFMMNESFLGQPRPPWRVWLKGPLVRWIMKRASGGFPTGRLAADYLAHYGIPRSQLAFIPNAPDVVAIRRAVEERRRGQADKRRQLGIVAHRRVVLYVGRLVKKKGVHLLLEAYASVALQDALEVIIVGDGVERSALEEQARALGIRDRIHFVGFAQPRELPDWYALADFFVLPSSESWGVVVLEALAARLPVIVTDQVGCHPDVVPDERMGTVIPAGNSAALADALMQWAGRPHPEQDIAEAWEAIFDSLRYPAIADRFVGNVRSCLRSGGR